MTACRQLGFDATGNSAIRSPDPEIWSFAYLGHMEPHLGEGEVVEGRRWQDSKELWWFPIDSPL